MSSCLSSAFPLLLLGPTYTRCSCRLQEILPTWAKLRVIDPAKPLRDQVIFRQPPLHCVRSLPDSLRRYRADCAGDAMALQVANAKVLIPTTGRVAAEDINAVTDLRLIVNPAAGEAIVSIIL